MPTDRAQDDAVDTELQLELGRWVRLMRRRQGKSLAAVAADSGLSQSFLSQMERGLVQPSLRSMNRVARALGTTASAIFALQTSEPVSVVRYGQGEVFSEARVLVRGNRAMHAIEIRSAPAEFGDYFEHPGEEMLYVISGKVEAEIGRAASFTLNAGDALYYEGMVGHRWRNVGSDPLQVLLVTDNHPAADS
jgi:transcriptional regulator with XRE-family HTH domain